MACAVLEKNAAYHAKPAPYHHCIGCGGFLRVPCGIVDADDRSTCHRCVQKLHSTVAGKHQSKSLPLATTGAATASPPAEQCNITSHKEKSSEERPVSAASKVSPLPRPSPPPPPPLIPPKTTSHKKQKRDGAETRIGLGKWIKVTHGDIFHVLSPNQCQHIPQEIGNSYPLFGNMLFRQFRSRP
jgi:hypothetical protein